MLFKMKKTVKLYVAWLYKAECWKKISVQVSYRLDGAGPHSIQVLAVVFIINAVHS